MDGRAGAVESGNESLRYSRRLLKQWNDGTELRGESFPLRTVMLRRCSAPAEDAAVGDAQ
jgi:hypothetical protein